ncbi:hypothetical protein RRG08_036368 [Elysia crispata]|uniref:Uncharacterized protein n=1 Tax=Elysia crispata TaxID=231223 RepID=A0AAE0ZKU5_9GAST|nr:hypothetical protein RRG08_036368 [Elysia crispata]
MSNGFKPLTETNMKIQMGNNAVLIKSPSSLNSVVFQLASPHRLSDRGVWRLLASGQCNQRSVMARGCQCPENPSSIAANRFAVVVWQSVSLPSHQEIRPAHSCCITDS